MTYVTHKTSATLGKQAEDAALTYLLQKGLRLVTRNYRAPTGEIDLVMDQSGTLVFVEIRYRRRASFGGALESVDSRKRARLVATALDYLQRHHEAAKRPIRFDVVAVGGLADQAGIEWIADAFRQDG